MSGRKLLSLLRLLLFIFGLPFWCVWKMHQLSLPQLNWLPKCTRFWPNFTLKLCSACGFFQGFKEIFHVTSWGFVYSKVVERRFCLSHILHSTQKQILHRLSVINFLRKLIHCRVHKNVPQLVCVAGSFWQRLLCRILMHWQFCRYCLLPEENLSWNAIKNCVKCTCNSFPCCKYVKNEHWGSPSAQEFQRHLSRCCRLVLTQKSKQWQIETKLITSPI